MVKVEISEVVCGKQIKNKSHYIYHDNYYTLVTTILLYIFSVHIK